jgi:hypothetical protein
MYARQSDAMTYMRRMGRADFFITMTCNPKWTEIASNLLPGQEAKDRPDVVTRVFRQKLKKMVDLLKKGLFGNVQAWLYSVEYQKRGLPHAHILIWLTSADRVRPDQIDQVVSAELPSKGDDPDLHNIVMAHMIHGPCGAINRSSPCMAEGQCSKNFPKNFCAVTEVAEDSYPRYRWRKPEEGGNTGVLPMRQRGHSVQQEVTNQWVVPYNPVLLRIFNCHINVEICTSIKSIQYVLKYVTKGTDQAVFQRTEHSREPIDEIALYQNARYVSSTEVAWRILEHPVHEHFPPVFGLAEHLENGQRVVFNEQNAHKRAQGPAPSTTLSLLRPLP